MAASRNPESSLALCGKAEAKNLKRYSINIEDSENQYKIRRINKREPCCLNAYCFFIVRLVRFIGRNQNLPLLEMNVVVTDTEAQKYAYNSMIYIKNNKDNAPKNLIARQIFEDVPISLPVMDSLISQSISCGLEILEAGN